MAACQGKLTPRVLWPLCRWTIEPCIRMKHPVAVTEPLFVSAVAPLLSLAALMSFSDSVAFQSSSVYRSFTFKWPHPDSVPVCETNLVCWGSVIGVRKVTHWRGNGLTVSSTERPDGTGALWTSTQCHSIVMAHQSCFLAAQDVAADAQLWLSVAGLEHITFVCFVSHWWGCC